MLLNQIYHAEKMQSQWTSCEAITGRVSGKKYNVQYLQQYNVL